MHIPAEKARASKLRVLLVDDHAVVRAGLARLLEDSGEFHVAEVDTGEAACEYARDRKPEVVIIDLSMPGIGGLEAVKRIRARYRDLPILVLSMHRDEFRVRGAMKAGANGFVSKGAVADELIEALHAVHRGENYLSGDVARSLATHSLTDDAEKVSSLSKREFEVFRRLANGETVAEIAERLNLSSKTVANHRLAVLKKLSAKNAVELAHLAMRHGLTEPLS
jgi:DNA-binding NarL/FixJ family response regulator